MELRDKASISLTDELRDNLNQFKTISLSNEEQLNHKLSNPKEDFEAKTKELMDSVNDAHKKLDEFDEGSEYDDESDQDLDSELGDTLDVNAMDKNLLARHGESEEEEPDDEDPSKAASTGKEPSSQAAEVKSQGKVGDDSTSGSGVLARRGTI